MDQTEILSKVKRRYAIDDEQQDELLNDFIEDAINHFKLITSASEIDTKYQFIITDVVSKMYNRKGSEGMESETVDGYSVKYLHSLFDDYLWILSKDFDLDDEDNQREKGKLVFY